MQNLLIINYTTTLYHQQPGGLTPPLLFLNYNTTILQQQPY